MATPEVKEFNIADIHIEPDLKKLLPEVDDDAKDLLKKLIDEYGGIREPLTLVVINDKDMLLDGHNRLRVADELGYTTVPVVFLDEITDIVDAEIWMINNQLSRRNMSDMERIQVILKLEPELKEQAKARQRGEVPNSAQVGKVVQILADMANVSRNTINQAKFIIATEDPALIAITDKEISFNKAYKYASMPAKDRQKKIQEAVRRAQAKEAKQALPKETTETPETVIHNDLEYTKISNHSYIHKTDDVNFLIVSFSIDTNGDFDRFPDGTLKICSGVGVGVGVHKRQAVVIESPLGGCHKNKSVMYLANIDSDDDRCDKLIYETYGMIDNMRMAKKLIDAIRIKEAPKPPTASEAKKAKKIADAEAEALAKAEKEKTAFGLLTTKHKEFYATLKKKDQKAVLAIIHATEPEAMKDTLTESLNGFGYVSYLEKQANKTVKTAPKTPKATKAPKAPATVETPTPEAVEAPEPIAASTNKKKSAKKTKKPAKAKTETPEELKELLNELLTGLESTHTPAEIKSLVDSTAKLPAKKQIEAIKKAIENQK